MSRFQALTSSVLDAELQMLQERLGLKPSERAELLREVAALAGWVVRQAEQGNSVLARRGKHEEVLVHPVIERLRARNRKAIGASLTLTDAEAVRLGALLDRDFVPPPALRAVLANLANPKRRPPGVRWKKSAA